MKKGKRILSILLAAVMILCTIPVSAWGESTNGDIVTYEVTGGNLYFDKSTGTITYCDTTVTKAVIPEKIEGVDVTGIGYQAFLRCHSLTSITIPSSVTNIRSGAFWECGAKSAGPIGSGCDYEFGWDVKIPSNAFNGCYSLTSIEIPDSVTSIGDDAFLSCYSLASIEIPDSVASIGDAAFEGCHSLTSIEIPDSVTSIGAYVFKGCSNLTSITIPDSVTSIEAHVFEECISLASITIPDSVTSIGAYVFEGCSNLTSITIPDSVTSIGTYVFEGCSSLASITIPDSITSIGNEAFYGCSSLTSITIPDSVTSIGAKAFYGCSSLTSITIPNSITSIGINAFSGCSSLTSAGPVGSGCDYEFGWDVKIPAHAFEGCSGLTSVEIPNSVTSIGDWTFNACSSLASIEIPNSVTSIGDWTFNACSSLTSITIPGSVNSIGSYTFSNCDKLTDVYYTGSEEQWNGIQISRGNECLSNATIHYNSTAPSDETVEGQAEPDLKHGDWNITAGKTVEDAVVYYAEIDNPNADYLKTFIESVKISYDSTADLPVTLTNEKRSVSEDGKRAEISYTIEYVKEGSMKLTAETAGGKIESALISTFITGSDALKKNHITNIKWERFEDVNIQQLLYINIYFDQELDLDATNSSDGYVEIWGNIDGNLEKIKTINAYGKTKDAPLYYGTFKGEENCLTVSIPNDKFYIWNKAIPAIPYDTELYLTISSDAVIFQNDETTFQGIGLNSNANECTVKTKWGLNADVDFLKFSNSSVLESNDEYAGFDDHNYGISDVVKKILLESAGDAIYKIKKNLTSEWTGSCLGMDTVMALTAINKLELKLYDSKADTCYDLASPKDSKGVYGVRDLINYYNIIQLMDTYPEHDAYRNLFVELENKVLNGAENWDSVANEIIERAKSFQETKTPLIICLEFETNNRRCEHACLAYGMEEYDDKYSLILYDPSCVVKETRLEIAKDDYSAVLIGGWESKGSTKQNPNYSCTLSKLGYVDPYDLESYSLDSKILNDRSKIMKSSINNDSQEFSDLYFSINSNCTITNSAGDYLSYQDGKLSGTMNVYSLRTVGVGEDSDAEYKIKVDKSEKFDYSSTNGGTDFTVYQDGCYFEAVTDNENIVATFIPGKSILIDGVGNVDYELVASVDSEEADMIAIKGKSAEPVTLEYTEKGQIQLLSDDASTAEVTLFDGTDVSESVVGELENELIITETPAASATSPVSGGGGGGGSSAVTGKVNLPSKTDNGSIALSPKNPAKGSTVTVTATPDEGYKTDRITVTDKSGKAVDVKDAGDGKYTFIMPDSEVSVDASFVKDETPENPTTNPSEMSFKDVSEGDYFYDAVKWAVENDITNGMPDGSFAPSASCTRAQVATFLWRAAGSPDTADSANFADVQSGSYYEKAVAWAAANGITLGTGSDTFSPDAVCSRGQIVTFLARYADGKPSAESSRFSDVSSNDYFADSVQWALENKITEGTSAEKFSPYADCTRAQVVTFLYRYCNGVN